MVIHKMKNPQKVSILFEIPKCYAGPSLEYLAK